MRWTHDLFDDPSESKVIHSNPQESTGTDFINNILCLTSKKNFKKLP